MYRKQRILSRSSRRTPLLAVLLALALVAASCMLPDRLIILPDRGEVRAPDVVLVEGAMVDEIDGFVSNIWDRIELWGIAVAGGYWKPVLHVNVAQGADERFRELQTLLDGSGLEVKRVAQ